MSGVSALGLSAASSATQTQNSVFSSDDFMKILIAELQSQDPMSPVSSESFLDQIVQLRSLEVTTKLSDSISSLMLQQQITSAGSLIGKTVTGMADVGYLIKGTVDSVIISGDQVRLMVNGYSMALPNLMEIGEG